MHRLLPICIALLLLTGCARTPDLPQLEGSWMNAQLPPSGATHLVFRAYVDEFTIAIDGQRVYEFRDAPARGKLTLHVVDLPPGARQLRVETRDPQQATRFGADAVLATRATLPAALFEISLAALNEQAPTILLSFALIAAGIAGLALAALRRRADITMIAGMALFTLLYGARLLTGTILPLLLGAPITGTEYTQAFLTYVIPIPGWFVPLRLLNSRSLRWQVFVFAVFAPIGIASDLITRSPGSLEQVNNVLVIAGGLNVFYNLLRTPERRSTELRVVLAGSVVFMLFALNNNLAALGLLPWRSIAEEVGFVVFLSALGFATVRSFDKRERERLELARELSTAREIQRSILPTSMPDVPGLTIDAAYDPATSVAGDLYDFLRVDDRHLGVLVADVAGHGVPAALIASMVKVGIASQRRLAHDPAALLGELNALLRMDVRRAFVTATYLWFDMERGEVTVCNAGHPPPLLHRSGEFHELGEHGMLLGRFAIARYTATTTKLQPGDRIAAFTDGLAEARNARGEQFGESRLHECIARGSASDAVAAVHQWRVEDDADDLTIVTINVR